MKKELKKDIIKYQKELKPFLNSLYNCSDEQTLGCVAKPKTPSQKKPTHQTRKRCPRGTRKNKKTGNCVPTGLKTHALPSPKKPSPKKPSEKVENMLEQNITGLRETLFVLISKTTEQNLEDVSTLFDMYRNDLKKKS